jgi:hypothetical protein
VARENRHEYPRSVLFFFSFIFLLIGLVLLLFIYGDFTQDQASLIFLKNLAPFNKFEYPKTFTILTLINFAIVLLWIGGGGFGIYKSITGINFRFKK